MDANKMYCHELRALAKKEKIKGYNIMNKEELYIALGFGFITKKQEKGGGK